MGVLKVYNPEVEGRIFKLDGPVIWDSRREGSIFFETDKYEFFTDRNAVERLLAKLIQLTHSGSLGVRISPIHELKAPSWLTEGSISEGLFLGRLKLEDLSKLCDYFDEVGNHETWTFYGLESGIGDTIQFRPFPTVLKEIGTFFFVVEIDLDGILIGFLNNSWVGGSDAIDQLEALN